MSENLFLRSIGPGFANGIKLSEWTKLLVRHQGRVGLPYLGRVAVSTFAATCNSLGARYERFRYGRRIDQAKIHPPLFVLGVWRSGTTHLQNLLCRDDRFAFPNTFQGINPHIFLSTERWFAPIQQKFLPERRPFDNVLMNVSAPYEDEFATAAMTGMSPLFSWVFPEGHLEFEKFIDFSQVPEQDVNRWLASLLHFARKLSLRYDKPLILKSPNHAARIRLLLQLFPDARFVFIHRHPHEIYVSHLNLIRRLVPFVTVQRFDVETLCQRTIPWYRTLTEAYLDQRTLIPKGRLVEISFRELEQSPMETLQHVYEQLDLPAFDAVESKFRDYLATLNGYRKNVYPEIEPHVKALLAREWKRSFDAWGYSD